VGEQAGLSFEQPVPPPLEPLVGPLATRTQFFGEPLTADVEAARVPMARPDDMVTRILTAMIAAGLLNHPPTGDRSKVVTTTNHQRLALQLSEQGAVLLTNRGHVLAPCAARSPHWCHRRDRAECADLQERGFAKRHPVGDDDAA